DGIVMDSDRNAAEPLRQSAPQRKSLPRWDIQGRHQAGRPLHRATAAAAASGQVRPRDVRSLKNLADQKVQRSPQLLGIEADWRRHLRPCEDAATRLNEAGC